MKFTLLLYALVKILRRTARKYPEFKKKLMEKNYSLVIKTEDGKRGRFFNFVGGTVVSRSGDASGADVYLSWKDAESGYRIMLSGRNKVVMAALQDGTLKIQGDGNLALFFTVVSQEMMKLTFKKKIRQ